METNKMLSTLFYLINFTIINNRKKLNIEDMSPKMFSCTSVHSNIL